MQEPGAFIKLAIGLPQSVTPRLSLELPGTISARYIELKVGGGQRSYVTGRQIN